MMKLVIIEKPGIGRIMSECDLLGDDTDTIYINSRDFARYGLPEIEFSDIPYADQPIMSRDLYAKLYLGPVNNNGKREPYKGLATDFSNTSPSLSFLAGRLPEYEEIICATDFDRVGFGGAKRILDAIGATFETPVYYLDLTYIDNKSMAFAWSDRHNNRWTADSIAQKLSDEQVAKLTFDYWWNSNSMLVMSELCKAAGIKPNKILSKYELMLICILDQRRSASDAFELDLCLADWPGTLRFYKDGSASIGSGASRRFIISNCIERGAIEPIIISGILHYQLTTSGKKLASMLHPDSFDRDLPFRINRWIKNNDYQAMQTYIKTLFGKQLRYQRKNNHYIKGLN